VNIDGIGGEEGHHGRDLLRLAGTTQGNRVEKRLSVNFYNTVRPHKGIANDTPLEKLTAHFFPESCKQCE
jgi:hypothetical protein